jgi:hypothetical protein
VTVTGLGLKDAAEEKGPIPPWSPRPRNAHEGFWNGLNPAGYKLVRRVPHARQRAHLGSERNHSSKKRRSSE